MAPRSEPEDTNTNTNSVADADDAIDASDPRNVYKLQHDLPAKARLDWFISSFRGNPRYRGRWETEIMQNTTCLAADPVRGTVVFEVQITDALCTIHGNLHGGAAATILDQLTSLVLHTYEAKEEHGGGGYGATATRTLTVTCLRPVFAGTTVRVEAELVGRGKTMGHVRGEIKTGDGKVCFACAHDKVILPRVAEGQAKL